MLQSLGSKQMKTETLLLAATVIGALFLLKKKDKTVDPDPIPDQYLRMPQITNSWMDSIINPVVPADATYYNTRIN